MNTTINIKLICSLNDSTKIFFIAWEIISRTQPNRIGDNRCDICMEEMYKILTCKFTLMNTIQEQALRCSHSIIYTLNRFK